MYTPFNDYTPSYIEQKPPAHAGGFSYFIEESGLSPK